ILTENNILSRIAEKHVNMEANGKPQICEGDFEIFKDTLILTICGGCDEQGNKIVAFDKRCRFDSEDSKAEEKQNDIEDAWRSVLRDGIHYMTVYLQSYRNQEQQTEAHP
ncbi:MAG: hypothetical protein AAFY72_15730, partial [Cyanobacteria bacterium J06649_4]